MRSMLHLICVVALAAFLLLATRPLGAADAPAASQPATPENRLADGNYTVAPPYAPLVADENAPKGKITQFTMKSTDSKLYPGIAKTQPGIVPYERKVAVYVPSQYVPGTPAPVIIVQDGLQNSYFKNVPIALDNLIAAKKLPPIVAVMVNSGGSDGKGSERGLEYDTVSGKYSDFIETEVLPRAAKETGVTFTTDPEGRATLGGSSGGACAFTMAWFHPERYRRVISYSGTFVAQESPDNPEHHNIGAWDYHEHIVPASEAKPIRIWMHVSENDNGAKAPEADHHNWVMANNHMAAVLAAKGYHYRYVYSYAARHVDARVVAATIQDALLYAWQDYKPSGK